MKKINSIIGMLIITFFTILQINTTSYANNDNSRYSQNYKSHVINNSNDFNLSNDTIMYVDNINKQYKQTKEKPQIVIEIIEELGGDTIEDYAVKEFERLKIGNKDYDNGILVIVSSLDRKFRIEVGYGLEGAITDTKAKNILDSSMQYFKSEDYSKGIKNIFNGISKEINKEYNIELSDLEQFDEEESEMSWGAAILVAIIVVIIIIQNNKDDGNDDFRRPRRRNVYYPGSFGSFGGGSSSSGSGGFSGGGGSSGGGGASGGW